MVFLDGGTSRTIRCRMINNQQLATWFQRRHYLSEKIRHIDALETALRRPDLVAIPEDPSQPTFLVQWGPVFMKWLKGEKISYLPENYSRMGWVEAKFVGE